METKIAFIGFGEVGQLFGRQLAAQAGVSVSTFDRLFADPEKAPKLKAIAADAQVRVASDWADACRGADVVVSAVTADAAIEAARQCASALAASQIYVDLNSISPTTKAAVAAAVAASRASFVEFAVMAPVAGPGIAVPILAGGADAAALAARLNRLGMKIDAVADRIGVASATKLCRSIVIKGLEAIMVDLNAAANAAGVMPAVLASLTASYPGMDWAEIARTMPGRVKRHGVRRAAEMREAARMLEEAGHDGAFAAAIADRHEKYAIAENNIGRQTAGGGTHDDAQRERPATASRRREGHAAALDPARTS
ncbi:MAG: NAD(P)-dependent oxidoreductase [Telmatospirillum sp.]|nr:NAD(P)-dependent oxidoreductase [Telmatospirillum sp.]